MDNWKDNRNVFWTLAGPGTFWLLVFFVMPLGFMFVMSFGEKAVINGEVSITDFDYLTGISNYIRSLDPLYLTIIWKSIWVSALATAFCLADRLSDRLRHLLCVRSAGSRCCCCLSSCRSGSISSSAPMR